MSNSPANSAPDLKAELMRDLGAEVPKYSHLLSQDVEDEIPRWYEQDKFSPSPSTATLSSVHSSDLNINLTPAEPYLDHKMRSKRMSEEEREKAIREASGLATEYREAALLRGETESAEGEVPNLIDLQGRHLSDSLDYGSSARPEVHTEAHVENEEAGDRIIKLNIPIFTMIHITIPEDRSKKPACKVDMEKVKEEIARIEGETVMATELLREEGRERGVGQAGKQKEDVPWIERVAPLVGFGMASFLAGEFFELYGGREALGSMLGSLMGER